MSTSSRGERTRRIPAARTRPRPRARRSRARRCASARPGPSPRSAPTAAAAPACPPPPAAGGRGERAAVAEVLGVEGDQPRRLVRGERAHQLGRLDVDLVAERGEAREAEPDRRDAAADLEREVAALGDQADRAAREVVGDELELRRPRRTPRGSSARACARPPRGRGRRAQASRAPPASPSCSPPLMATIARAPAAIASSTDCSSAAAGTERTASSIGPGSSRSERCAGRPRTSPPRRLTRCTSRRPSPRSARTASQCPHFRRSSEAPTTATAAGSKSAGEVVGGRGHSAELPGI